MHPPLLDQINSIISSVIYVFHYRQADTFITRRGLVLAADHTVDPLSLDPIAHNNTSLESFMNILLLNLCTHIIIPSIEFIVINQEDNVMDE
jgi:hypothetical protein